MYILGISCYYHDAAASLIKDGQLVAAAEEVESVDCVIFPESAVDESEIADLEALLEYHGVIYLQTGVR